MKRAMILEKCKTKAISLMMAGIMVFAMAPLGTAVAFADEENADAANAAVAGTEETVEEDAINAADTEEAAPAAEDTEAEVVAAAINKGYITIDMSTGTKVYKYTKEDLERLEDGTTKIPEGIMALQGLLTFAEMGLIDGVGSEQEMCTLYDLDKNGAYDIQLSAGLDATQTYAVYTLTKLGTCSIKKEISLTMPEEFLETAEEQLAPNAEYYMGLKFVFAKSAPAPVAKKANTLTLKAKKAMKIKAKKMKKKAKSFNISKFVAISGAQGAVTYAKAAGNKKITVASNGKVTLQKKIKKGTYKVTVNVTAAGNGSYNKVTKAVTFTVKVKK